MVFRILGLDFWGFWVKALLFRALGLHPKKTLNLTAHQGVQRHIALENSSLRDVEHAVALGHLQNQKRARGWACLDVS